MISDDSKPSSSRRIPQREIAERAGFQELDWFYKKFREVTGKSATQYRMEKLSESVKPTKEDRQCDSELAIIPSTGRKSDGRGMSN